jgi:2,4-dienoyl-CoA reductase-like NADH-dependent reductase (Old Yellow Enzyme family)
MDLESRPPRQSHLHSPVTIRGVTLKNRIMVSPMCMYGAGIDGLATEFHIVHLGRFALGGAGLVMVEATAVEERGRISNGDLGLWSDEQIEPLARVARSISSLGGVAAIQLAHAGRKAAISAPWNGMSPLTAEDAMRGDAPWPVIGPTATPAGSGWQTPRQLTIAEIPGVIQRWADATRRAMDAGFDVVELHAAHGYLIHSFLSPISNTRTDEYGGSWQNRLRFPLELVDAVRRSMPDEKALMYRTSSVDGVEGGLSIDDTVRLAEALVEHGVDVVDTSSGGVTAERSLDTRVRRGFAFHAGFSREIKQRTRALTATVGLVIDAEQAEALVREGFADIIAVGREMLNDPNWAHHTQRVLEGANYDAWRQESGWWLDKREAVIDRLLAQGETPLSLFD